MNKKKHFIEPIVIALAFEAICFTGWEFMPHQNILMFVLMLLTFIGLLMNILRGDGYIWSGEGKSISVITGLLTIVFARIGSLEYFIDGLQYIGTILGVVLMAVFLWKYIANTEIKGKPAAYLILAVLIIMMIITVITAFTVPKTEIRF